MKAVDFPTQYDQAIRFATNSYLVPWPWTRLKAQLYQESLLDPKAESSAGAQGIAQFMPDTWDDVIERMGFPHDATPFDPTRAIPAAAWYMRTLRHMWTAPRSDVELWRLSLASYNAGFGNIHHAQQLSGGLNDFTGIMSYLPAVTGHDNALQTRTYVERIEKYCAQLEGAGA